MEIKRILSKIALVIILAVCYVPTAQGQFFKKLLKEVMTPQRQSSPRQTSPRQTSQQQNVQESVAESQEKKSVLIFDIDEIYRQKIDVVLADDDLYKYPVWGKFNEYEMEAGKVRKYPGLTFTPDLYDKAMSGDPVALNKLGYCYYQGLGVDMDREKSKYYFTESAKNDMSESIMTLLRTADMYEADWQLLKQIADKNYAPACMEYYFHTKDEEYLMKAARLLYPSAFRVLGSEALELKKFKESIDLDNKAEELGYHNNDDSYTPYDNEALYVYQAYYYYYSDNVEDNEKYFILTRYAPTDKFPQYNMMNWSGRMYSSLPSIREPQLEELYRKLLAANKLTDNIKLVYNALKFPSLDEMQQYKWRQNLEQYVATNNNVYALAELGKCYYDGKGVSAKDENKAVSYLRKAADRGLICAARWCADYFKDKDKALYNKYMLQVYPNYAKQQEKQTKELRPFVGTWKIDKFNWTLTFDEKGDVTITAKNTKNISIKDPLYLYNKIVYNVTCTSVRECKTVYNVKNAQLYFMEGFPFNLKSIKVIKPANPNNYVREYVNKNGETIAPCPMFSAISGKVTIVSPTEIRVVGEGGQTVVLRKIR